MRITMLNGLVALLFASVPTQNPAAPATITPRLDAAQARVIVATLQPRTPAIAANGHATDRVLIYLDSGTMTLSEEAGRRPLNFTAAMSGGGRRADGTWRKTSAITRSAFSRST